MSDLEKIIKAFSNPANFDYARDGDGYIVSRANKYAMMSWGEAQVLVAAAKRSTPMAKKTAKKAVKAKRPAKTAAKKSAKVAKGR